MSATIIAPINHCNNHEDDAPLPLSTLQTVMSQETYSWLQGADLKEDEWKAQLEEERSNNAIHLFGDGITVDDYECRVQEWTSSRHNADGIGGMATGDDHDEQIANPNDIDIHINDNNNNNNNGGSFDSKNESGKKDPEAELVTVKYILSEAPGGHGDAIWAASRHVANLFANPTKCRTLLSPIIPNDSHPTSNPPLAGKSVIELGAGAGIPSWTALHCGAKIVVCTDQGIANRIRCLAECAVRNLDERSAVGGSETTIVKVCPYDWGTPIDQILQTLVGCNADTEQYEQQHQQQQLFDIIIAADCIYMPSFHKPLLQSIKLLMKKQNKQQQQQQQQEENRNGMALLPFALHGNTKDENVWNIVPMAQEMGFCVEVLEAEQLTPQCRNMESKRALVNMLRLTWNSTGGDFDE